MNPALTVCWCHTDADDPHVWNESAGCPGIPWPADPNAQASDVTTIYVAGPMTGLPEYNYPAFEAAGTALAALGYRVLNPLDAEDHNPTPGIPQTWDWYMRHCIRMVLEADAVALLPGWENSRGATLEHSIASALNLDIRPIKAWLRVPAARS